MYTIYQVFTTKPHSQPLIWNFQNIGIIFIAKNLRHLVKWNKNLPFSFLLIEERNSAVIIACYCIDTVLKFQLYTEDNRPFILLHTIIWNIQNSSIEQSESSLVPSMVLCVTGAKLDKLAKGKGQWY